ncbi:MAG: GIY-YIG nuclease family protein [Planctomycetota bacterium]
MQIHLDWQKPIPIQRDRSGQAIYKVDLDSLPPEPGIYLFFRRHGDRREVLYVGRSANIRRRIKGHLNSVKLMHHLQNARSGKIFLAAGLFSGRYGEQAKRKLALAEKALIRHYIAEGHDLANQQGVKLRFHLLENTSRMPKSFLPTEIYMERR